MILPISKINDNFVSKLTQYCEHSFIKGKSTSGQIVARLVPMIERATGVKGKAISANGTIKKTFIQGKNTLILSTFGSTSPVSIVWTQAERKTVGNVWHDKLVNIFVNHGQNGEMPKIVISKRLKHSNGGQVVNYYDQGTLMLRMVTMPNTLLRSIENYFNKQGNPYYRHIVTNKCCAGALGCEDETLIGLSTMPSKRLMQEGWQAII